MRERVRRVAAARVVWFEMQETKRKIERESKRQGTAARVQAINDPAIIHGFPPCFLNAYPLHLQPIMLRSSFTRLSLLSLSLSSTRGSHEEPEERSGGGNHQRSKRSVAASACMRAPIVAREPDTLHHTQPLLTCPLSLLSPSTGDWCIHANT